MKQFIFAIFSLFILIQIGCTETSASDNSNLKLSVGDCMDFKPSATMVGAPNPKKVACDSEEAKSKITKLAKDKSECEGGYITTYGADKNKSYYCVVALEK